MPLWNIMYSTEQPTLTKEQEKEKEKEMAAYFEEYEREHRAESLSQIHQRVCFFELFNIAIQTEENGYRF